MKDSQGKQGRPDEIRDWRGGARRGPETRHQFERCAEKDVLAVKSVGYSTGASGVYLEQLFQRMGIAEQVKSKLKQTPSGVTVGSIIASGEVELGFQQVSELIHSPGIDYVGPLPAAIQQVTVFSAGIHSGAKQPAAARDLVKFLTSPAAAPVIKKHGMEPG
ncbi:molybdate ABC transporter substrate-binding protein [Bradyrhizobium sp.]|uniref:molybdate ABC transporter substrate-binding protein n=1 Tax=Bradyrhizobium sp. TaxID=376 RepID=UPI003C39E51C